MTDWGTQLPEIRATPPGPRSRELSHRLAKSESPACSPVGAGQDVVFWERAWGANVEDVDGNRYIDLTAGFGVSAVGHSNPRVAKAIAAQAEKMMHHPAALNPTPLRVELTERLAEMAPNGLSVTHLATGGAEAVEIALKAARLYTGKANVVAFQGGFHGKTLGALSLTSQAFYRAPFQSLLNGVLHAPFPNCYRCPLTGRADTCGQACADYLEYLLTIHDSGAGPVAAVILELVQGQGGFVVPPRDFVRRVREITEQHGILMIVDEMITGFGRTGRLFAVEHFDVVPDILVLGKGLASGFPIGATVMRPEIAASFKPMQHSSTFMGNAMGCAAALASLDELSEGKLVEHARDLGEYFLERLCALKGQHALIGDVRGLGLMIGVEFVRDRVTKEPASVEGQKVVDLALRQGVMMNNYGGTHKNVIKISPPLMLSREQVDYAIDVLDRSLTAVESERVPV